MNKAQKTAAFKTAFITGATIFIMGYVNGLALHTGQMGYHAELNAMVTAQSGNVIWMGLNPAFGQWDRFGSNLMLFFGFIFGCGFAFMNQNLIKHKTAQFFFNWALFTLPVALFPFYQAHVNSQVAFLMMGLSSGFGCGFFRKMYHLDINNAMATGSVRFLGVWFGEAAFNKKDKGFLTLGLFAICVVLFSLGAFLFGIAFNMDNAGTTSFSMVTVLLLVICVIPCLFAPSNKSEA